MSQLGQKRTLCNVTPMSALPPKANIAELEGHVRFVPEADILRCGEKCRYSITSSARANSAGGTARPQRLAFLRLVASPERKHFEFPRIARLADLQPTN
jgi:hypothetical protein